MLETNGPKELELENKKFTKISIFMDVLSCHVNRIPYTGTIDKIFYTVIFIIIIFVSVFLVFYTEIIKYNKIKNEQ